MATLEKHGDYWRAKIRRKGYPIQTPSTQKRKANAGHATSKTIWIKASSLMVPNQKKTRLETFSLATMKGSIKIFEGWATNRLRL